MESPKGARTGSRSKIRAENRRRIDSKGGVGTVFDSPRSIRGVGPLIRDGSLTSHEIQKALRSATHAFGRAERERVLNRDESKPEPPAIRTRMPAQQRRSPDGERPA